MKGGDIAGPGDFAPRLLFQFEGLIGHVDPKDSRQYNRAFKRERWDEVIDLYTTDSRMLARLWDLSWKHSFGLDLVTFLPEGVQKHLKERNDRERWPFGWVISTNPDYLSRQIANDITVARIFIGQERDGVWFGSKMRWVTDPNVTSFLE